jgi:CheY-like chemotaxis protein
MRTPESFHILVTDINHHVRNFLQRELEKEGYDVCSVKNGTMAYERIFTPAPLDLIILDPEVFHYFDQSLLEEMIRRHPSLQIIIHTYADSMGDLRSGKNMYLVEKDGHSIRAMKSIIGTCFDHFQASENPGSFPEKIIREMTEQG